MKHILETIIILALGGECIKPKCFEYRDNSNDYLTSYYYTKDHEYFDKALEQSKKFQECKND